MRGKQSHADSRCLRGLLFTAIKGIIMSEKCPYHTDHENRIERLEDEMKEVQKNQKSPAVTVALIGLIGTAFSGVSAFCGVIAVSYLKAKGYLP